MTIVAWLRGGVIELIWVRSRADVAAFVYIFFFHLGFDGEKSKRWISGIFVKDEHLQTANSESFVTRKRIKKKNAFKFTAFFACTIWFPISFSLSFFFFFFFLKRKITSFGRRNWRIFEKLIKSLQVFRFLLD